MNNCYKREEGSDILGIYFGRDEEQRYSLLIKFKECPKIDIKTNLLETNIGKRKDSLWALQVSLNDPKYYGVFRVLVEDLVDVVKKQVNQNVAERKLIKRFNEWQNMFDINVSNLLSFKQVQGLIGELFFLKNILFVRKGIEKSLQSWVGPIGANKDFQFETKWFEIKTKSEFKETVTISNSEQLQSDIGGYLIVINSEKVSELKKDAISLNSLHYEILDLIKEDRLKKIYFQRLFNINFVPLEEYDQYYFLIKKVTYYEIDKGSPFVTVSDKEMVMNLKYDIFLPSIDSMKTNETGVWVSELPRGSSE